MLHIGCHLSSAKGFFHMGQEALSIGADTFAFFTRNPRGGNAKPIDQKDIAELKALMSEHHFAPLVAHAPYTFNLCSANPQTREFAREKMADDLRVRMEAIPGNYYNFHPGSHVGQGIDKGIELIAEGLNELLFEDMHTTVLLETMAGKGSEVGSSFEELRAIIDRVDPALRKHLGVCLDTCHVSDAGYDIKGDLDGVLRAFDSTIGLDRLRAVHLNDSKNLRSSHKDRHEKIGHGTIGLEALSAVTRHPVLRGLPFILETPNELGGYAEEIRTLRELWGETA